MIKKHKQACQKSTKKPAKLYRAIQIIEVVGPKKVIEQLVRGRNQITWAWTVVQNGKSKARELLCHMEPIP